MTAADTTWSSISIHYDCNRVIGVFCLWVNQHPPSSSTCTRWKAPTIHSRSVHFLPVQNKRKRPQVFTQHTIPTLIQPLHWTTSLGLLWAHSVLRTFSITTAGQEVKRSLKSWGRSVSPSDSLYKVFEQEDKYLACISYSKNWYYTHRFGTQ